MLKKEQRMKLSNGVHNLESIAGQEPWLLCHYASDRDPELVVGICLVHLHEANEPEDWGFAYLEGDVFACCLCGATAPDSITPQAKLTVSDIFKEQ